MFLILSSLESSYVSCICFPIRRAAVFQLVIIKHVVYLLIYSILERRAHSV
jgi:hypothetical protein